MKEGESTVFPADLIKYKTTLYIKRSHRAYYTEKKFNERKMNPINH